MNSKLKSLLLLLILCLLLTPVNGVHAESGYKWIRKDGKWYYCNTEGDVSTDWQKIDGKWYYFDKNGVMLTGWQPLGNWRYYLSPSGAMVTGWQKIDGIWYYFNAGGGMMTDWQKINGKWYYLSKDEDQKGQMVIGWKTINDRNYYFDPSGAMATGWRKVDGYWYLMSPGGAMLTGWQKIGSNWYFLDANGAMATGWRKVGANWYYLREDGIMLTGWQKINNKWYLLGPGGAMQTGWQKIGNNWYFLDASGAMATGWRTIGDRTYFLADGGVLADCGGEGTMLRGFHLIDGKVCFFGMGGALQEDWASKNVIVIDPGHSSEIPSWKVPVGPGSDDMKDADNYGAVSVTNGLHEYELVLDVSLKLKEKLEAKGYKVVMVRTTNSGKYSCVDRAKVANNSNAAVFLRVHANAAPKTPSQNGAMTICITEDNEFVPEMYKRSRQLSDLILREYIKAVGCYNEGVWERDDMIANNWSKVPTTLIELGYMTNAREDQLMQTPSYQEKMVNGLLNGIDSYFRAINN